MHRFEPGFSGHDSMRSKAEKLFRDEAREDMKVRPSASNRSEEKTRLYANGGHAKHTVKHHRMSHDQTDMHIPRVKKTPPLKVMSMEQAEKMSRGGRSHKAMGGIQPITGHPPAHNMRRGGHRKHRAEGGPTLTGVTNRAAGHLKNAMENTPGNIKRAAHSLKSFMHAEGGEIGMPAHSGIRQQAHGMRGNMKSALANRHAAKQMPFHGENMKKGGRCHKAEGGLTSYESQMVGEHPSHKRPHINYESSMRGEHGHMQKSRQNYAMGGVGKMRHNVANKEGRQIKHKEVQRNNLFGR